MSSDPFEPRALPAKSLGFWVTGRKAAWAFKDGVVRFVRSSPLGAVSAVFLTAMLVVAVLADQLAPHDPIKANYAISRQGPMPGHPLGADHMGRDVLSRIIYGARISLFVGLASVLMGDSIGLLWGIVSGYLGGRVDLFSQRVLDSLQAFPSLILAMLLLVGLAPASRPWSWLSPSPASPSRPESFVRSHCR